MEVLSNIYRNWFKEKQSQDISLNDYIKNLMLADKEDAAALFQWIDDFYREGSSDGWSLEVARNALENFPILEKASQEQIAEQVLAKEPISDVCILQVVLKNNPQYIAPNLKRILHGLPTNYGSQITDLMIFSSNILSWTPKNANIVFEALSEKDISIDQKSILDMRENHPEFEQDIFKLSLKMDYFSSHSKNSSRRLSEFWKRKGKETPQNGQLLVEALTMKPEKMEFLLQGDFDSSNPIIKLYDEFPENLAEIMNIWKIDALGKQDMSIYRLTHYTQFMLHVYKKEPEKRDILFENLKKRISAESDSFYLETFLNGVLKHDSSQMAYVMKTLEKENYLPSRDLVERALNVGTEYIESIVKMYAKDTQSLQDYSQMQNQGHKFEGSALDNNAALNVAIFPAFMENKNVWCHPQIYVDVLKDNPSRLKDVISRIQTYSETSRDYNKIRNVELIVSLAQQYPENFDEEVLAQTVEVCNACNPNKEGAFNILLQAYPQDVSTIIKNSSDTLIDFQILDNLLEKNSPYLETALESYLAKPLHQVGDIKSFDKWLDDPKTRPWALKAYAGLLPKEYQEKDHWGKETFRKLVFTGDHQHLNNIIVKYPELRDEIFADVRTVSPSKDTSQWFLEAYGREYSQDPQNFDQDKTEQMFKDLVRGGKPYFQDPLAKKMMFNILHGAPQLREQIAEYTALAIVTIAQDRADRSDSSYILTPKDREELFTYLKNNVLKMKTDPSHEANIFDENFKNKSNYIDIIEAWPSLDEIQRQKSVSEIVFLNQITLPASQLQENCRKEMGLETSTELNSLQALTLKIKREITPLNAEDIEEVLTAKRYELFGKMALLGAAPEYNTLNNQMLVDIRIGNNMDVNQTERKELARASAADFMMLDDKRYVGLLDDILTRLSNNEEAVKEWRESYPLQYGSVTKISLLEPTLLSREEDDFEDDNQYDDNDDAYADDDADADDDDDDDDDDVNRGKVVENYNNKPIQSIYNKVISWLPRSIINLNSLYGKQTKGYLDNIDRYNKYVEIQIKKQASNQIFAQIDALENNKEKLEEKEEALNTPQNNLNYNLSKIKQALSITENITPKAFYTTLFQGEYDNHPLQPMSISIDHKRIKIEADISELKAALKPTMEQFIRNTPTLKDVTEEIKALEQSISVLQEQAPYQYNLQDKLSFHDALFWLPDGLNAEEKQSLSLFLNKQMFYHDVKGCQHSRNPSELNIIANGWKGLLPEERALPYKDIFVNVCAKAYDFKDAAFAAEAAKSALDEGRYAHDEDIYLASQNVPAPFDTEQRFTSGKLSGRFLRRDEPMAGFIGTPTSCCQHFGGVATTSAGNSVKDPNAQVFVVENDRGEVLMQSWVYRSDLLNLTENGDIFRGVCFDNIEGRKSAANYERSVLAIYKEAAKFLVSEGYAQVTVGESNSKVDLSSLPMAEIMLDLPKSFHGYSDAVNSQYLLAQDFGNALKVDYSNPQVQIIPGSYDEIEETKNNIYQFINDACFQENATRVTSSFDERTRLLFDDKEGVVGYIIYNDESSEIKDMAVLAKFKNQGKNLILELLKQNQDWSASAPNKSCLENCLTELSKRGILTFAKKGNDDSTFQLKGNLSTQNGKGAFSHSFDENEVEEMYPEDADYTNSYDGKFARRDLFRKSKTSRS